jgi:hypothetical protein
MVMRRAKHSRPIGVFDIAFVTAISAFFISGYLMKLPSLTSSRVVFGVYSSSILVILSLDYVLFQNKPGEFTHLDEQLYQLIYSAFKSSWFYAVSLAQLALIRYTMLSRIAKSDAELLELRKKNFFKYREALTTTTGVVSVVLVSQALCFYLSDRSLTQACVGLVVSTALACRV